MNQTPAPLQCILYICELYSGRVQTTSLTPHLVRGGVVALQTPVRTRTHEVANLTTLTRARVEDGCPTVVAARHNQAKQNNVWF